MISAIDGFDIQKAGPIDFRYVVANQTARLALTWVYKGLLTYQLDNTTFYKYKGVPPSNLVGDWDTILNTGATGTPGSVWYNGSGVPGGGLGIVGDYYLDTANGNVYQKTGVSTWTLVTNIKGPTGASGTASGDYASIVITAGATAQGLTGVDAKIINFTANGSAVGSTPDYANNKITIINPGDYILYFNADMIGIAGKLYQLTIYKGGVASSVLGTFDCTTDTHQTVGFQQAINISAPNTVIELYGKQISGGTQNITLVTSILGVIGVNSKGATGNPGTALLHTEHDITFDDAKVTAVQGGAWTAVAPWTASIAADNRSNLAVPAAITGNKVGHSLAYNGSTWSDNGVWRGPTGATGSPGSTGSPGPTGPAGLIPQYLFIGAIATTVLFENQAYGWYNCYCSPTGTLVLSTGCPTGTLVTVTRFNTSPNETTLMPDSYYAGHPLVQRNTSELSYNGTNVASLPLSVRNATFLYSGDGAGSWKCIGSSEYILGAVTSVNGLTGDVIIPIANLDDLRPDTMSGFNPTNNLGVTGVTPSSSFVYPSWTFAANYYTIPYIEYMYTCFASGGSDADVTATIQASPDNTSWSDLKSQTLRMQANQLSFGHISVVDRQFITPGSTWYYRLTLTCGSRTFQGSWEADRTSYGVISGGS